MARPSPWGYTAGSVAMLLALVVLGTSRPAAADDLPREVAQVAKAWRKHGARVTRVATVFVERAHHRVIELPPLGVDRYPCSTVLAMAERPIWYTLSVHRRGAEVTAAFDEIAAHADPAGGGQDRAVVRSKAGLARLSLCGEKRSQLRKVRVQMGSARGTIELLLAAHAGGLPAVERILPVREVGAIAPRGELGQPLRPAPLADRVARATEVARADGATAIVRLKTRASNRGAGGMLLRLGAGCHRLSVLAGDGGPARSGVDLDAKVSVQGSDESLGEDRSHAPDARLDFCLGEAKVVELDFVGAGGPVEVVVLDARWPLFDGRSQHWGPEALAGLAWALHRQRAPAPASLPVLQALGGPGVTLVPAALEPGSCYVAAVAPVAGQAQASRLSARVGARELYDEASSSPNSVAVSFCARQHRLADLQVDLRARGGWWLLAMWRMPRGHQ